jgi:hypothetical protein
MILKNLTKLAENPTPILLDSAKKMNQKEVEAETTEQYPSVGTTLRLSEVGTNLSSDPGRN